MEYSDEDIEKYLTNMNKIIKSGSPKYIAYVSKEYLRLRKENPNLAESIQAMINTHSKKPGSIYAILVDSDGSINFNSIDDLSRVSNVAELVKNVEALADQNVDFGTISSEELIVEGMQIAEDLAREVDSLDSSIDYESENIDESVVSDLESEADNAISVASQMGSAGAGIFAIISAVRSKIAGILSKIRSGRSKATENKENESKDNSNNTENKSNDSNKNNGSFIPKVVTPVINKAIKKEEKESKKTKKGFNVDGTDDYDPSDDDVFDIDE